LRDIENTILGGSFVNNEAMLLSIIVEIILEAWIRESLSNGEVFDSCGILDHSFHELPLRIFPLIEEYPVILKSLKHEVEIVREED